MRVLAAVLAQTTTTAVAPCGGAEKAGAVCRNILRLTHNQTLADTSELVLVKPARILFILGLAWLVTHLLRRAIHRFVHGLKSVQADVVAVAGRSAAAGTLLRTGPTTNAMRGSQRAETLGSLLVSISSATVWAIAVVMCFAELGLDIGPLLTGAGIVGIALGFGAQNLVKDFLSGIFMLIEDQYGVGDVIDAGPASGVVEGVSLRTTRLRDVEGNVWHIPNGQIDRIANKSQQWSRALLDIEVAYGTDLDHASRVIKGVADDTWRDEKIGAEVLDEPEVWGVERFDADGVAIRLVVKTAPQSQWRVARQLRARIKAAFDAEGIEMPFPQRVVWHRTENGNGNGSGHGPVDGQRGAGPAPGPAQVPPVPSAAAPVSLAKSAADR